MCRGMKRDFPDELPRLAFSTQRANFRPSCQRQPEGNAALNPSGDLILFLVNTQFKFSGRSYFCQTQTDKQPSTGRWRSMSLGQKDDGISSLTTSSC